MQALVIRSLDGPSAMELSEVPEPEPAPGEILIEVAAAGMAFPDLLLTRGQYQYRPDPPFIPGSEIAGRVIHAPESSHVGIGQAVAAYPFLGGFGERVAVPPERVFPLPEGFDLDVAASMPINYLTMHFGLLARGRLQPGEWVVVHGAGGGLGLAAIQIAKAYGGRVIAVASTETKRQVALEAGADDAVAVEGFLEAVRARLGERGADIVVDPVGGERVTDSLRCLGPFGRLLVLGFTSGEIASVKTNRLLLNNLDVVGVGWGAYAIPRPGYMVTQWQDLMTRFSEAGIQVIRPTIVQLTDIPEALATMDDRTLTGKVVARLA